MSTPPIPGDPRTAPERRRPARTVLRVGLGLAGAAAAGAVALLAGCASMPKDEVRARLLALPKNAPVAAIGLSSLTMRADLGDGEREYELVYLKVPADPDAAPADGSARTPVVLVHGTPDTLFAWTPVVFGEGGSAGLAGPRDVYAIEVIGHGVAPGSGSGTTFERCARYVNAAVRALGLERAHLVGNSYGGEFAWRAALNDPNRFASLTIVDSSGYARLPEDFLPEEVAMRENPLAPIGYAINSPDRIETALAPHFERIPEGRVEEVYLVCSNRENWRAMVGLVRDEEGHRQEELRALSVPTLVVWGSDDLAYDVDRYGRRFAEDVPFARLAVFEDTGHYPHEQRPAEFVRTLSDFYRELEDE